MTRWVLLGTVVLMLGGCGIRERVGNFFNRSPDLIPYRASVAKGEDSRDIFVTVRAGGATVAQVRESVRYGATDYCLTRFGNSDTRWAIDPATGDWAFERSGDAMTFSGRCVAR